MKNIVLLNFGRSFFFKMNINKIGVLGHPYQMVFHGSLTLKILLRNKNLKRGYRKMRITFNII